MAQGLERACPYADRPWHLDCTDAGFVHCCAEATKAADDWLTRQGTFSAEEGVRLHSMKVLHLLGVGYQEHPVSRWREWWNYWADFRVIFAPLFCYGVVVVLLKIVGWL